MGRNGGGGGGGRVRGWEAGALTKLKPEGLLNKQGQACDINLLMARFSRFNVVREF